MTSQIALLLGPLLKIIWIDIVLSGDNAVVIGLACRSLPPRQRRLGIVLGSGAAILLRVGLTALVVEMLAWPFLRLIGGMLLLWIAVKLAVVEHGKRSIASGASVFAAVRIIVTADAVMSLDNIVAVAAAAKGSVALVLFGLAMSVPIIIFGASLLVLAFTRFPFLVWAGAALLGYVAGELIAAERLFAGADLTRWQFWDLTMGLCGAAFVLGVAALLRAIRLHPDKG